MDNKDIVRNLRLLSNLMEINGENEFKVRGYGNAIYNIERLQEPLEGMDLAELEKLNGIGKSIAARIFELNETGGIEILQKYLADTPPGILELMEIKGLGNKKIRTLWHELDITSIQEVLDGIEHGALDSVKGFGGKVQQNIKDAIGFYLKSKSKMHYAEAEIVGESILSQLQEKNKNVPMSLTGQLRRRCITVDEISIQAGSLDLAIDVDGFNIDESASSPYQVNGHLDGIPLPIKIYCSDEKNYWQDLFLTTGSGDHLLRKAGESSLMQLAAGNPSGSEEDIYKSAALPYIEPELREGLFEFDLPAENKLLEFTDLKGILHNHTTWSDGRHSLVEMAEYCKELGYEYVGISDHSKAAAFYANGLDEDRVRQQQKEIDDLNNSMSPFRIFKGIEADILPDGEIDYDNETLASFDFVVASIHSVLNMDVVKATDRLIKAIQNPFTTFLGHMTGRLLLIRDGYPVDHKAIIDACAEHNVIIEVNSHPNRLDIDWHWIPYAMQKGVMLSINPDAHQKEGYQHMYYGVCASRKGGLTPEMTFNTKSSDEVVDYFEKRRQKAIKAVS